MNEKTKAAMFSLNDELKTFSETTMITVPRKDLEVVVKSLFNSGGEWSNQSALGYAIAAAKSLEMSDDDIWQLIGAMRSEFDLQTLESAAEIYRQSDY